MKSPTRDVSFECGSTIYNEKTPAESLYIIKSGEVGIFKKGTDGKKVPIAIVGANEFLGELSLAQKKDRTSSAIALTHVMATQISKVDFEKQIKDSNPWVRALLMHTIQRLQATNETLRINHIVDKKVQEKIESYLAQNQSLRARISGYSPHD